MKIEQKKEFSPVTITLETPEELSTFYHMCNYSGETYLVGYPSGYDESFDTRGIGMTSEKFRKIRRKFWDLLQNIDIPPVFP